MRLGSLTEERALCVALFVRLLLDVRFAGGVPPHVEVVVGDAGVGGAGRACVETREGRGEGRCGVCEGGVH